MQFYEFKKDVLGLRYKLLTNAEITELKVLHEKFNTELSNISKISESFKCEGDGVISIPFATKDRTIREYIPTIIENPVEVDMNLAFVNVMKTLLPDFFIQLEPYIEKTKTADRNVRMMYKFLLNYSIGMLSKYVDNIATSSRKMVNVEIDIFTKKHKLNDYILFKKRDGMLLDLPPTFIISDLRNEPDKFKVESFRIGIVDDTKVTKHMLLTLGNRVIVKGVGDVPPGIVNNTYKNLLNTVAAFGNTREVNKHLNLLINNFFSSKDMTLFAIPNNNDYTIKMKGGIDVNVDGTNLQQLPVDYEYYYTLYLEPWIGSLLRYQ